MSRRFRLPALAVVLACAGTLAGCGVKGPLEPPQAAATQPASGQAATGQSGAAAASTAASSTAASTTAPQGPRAVSRVNITSSVGSTTGGGGIGASSGGSGAQAGGSTAAPVSLDQVKRPTQPFILDGLL